MSTPIRLNSQVVQEVGNRHRGVRWLMAALIALTLLLGPTVQSASAWTWPGMTLCGTMRVSWVPGHRIIYYAHGIHCATARAIEYEIFLAPASHRVVHNAQSRNAWTGLRRFKGWRCYFGAGGGQCIKGRMQSGFQI